MKTNAFSIPKNIILTLILLSIIPFSIAEPTPVPVYNEQTIVSNNDLQNLITQEGIKTRTEITLYADRKISEMITTVKTDGQKFIDDNFKVFDKRMHELALKIQIQFLIGIFCTIILAQGLWWIIARILNKKDKDRPRYINLDTYTAQKYGLISEEYQEKITKEDQTVVKKVVTTEEKPTPIPPSMTEIEAMLYKMKIQKQQNEQKNKAEQLKKQYERDAKKQTEIDKQIMKLKEKEDKKTRKIREKAQKLEMEKKKLLTNSEDPFFQPPTPPEGLF